MTQIGNRTPRAYTDAWTGSTTRDTMVAISDPATFKVTYRGDAGQRFSVLFKQKPNPIGFHVRLPGDEKGKAPT